MVTTLPGFLKVAVYTSFNTSSESYSTSGKCTLTAQCWAHPQGCKKGKALLAAPMAAGRGIDTQRPLVEERARSDTSSLPHPSLLEDGYENL